MDTTDALKESVFYLIVHKKYKLALSAIDRQLSTMTTLSSERMKWLTYKVYCCMKLQQYANAAEELDALPVLPTTSVEGRNSFGTYEELSSCRLGIKCSLYDFLLQLMAAILPLCIAQIGNKNLSKTPRPFPSFKNVHYLNRLYSLLNFVHLCKKTCLEEKKRRLGDVELDTFIEAWNLRHLLTVQCLVCCLIQLDLYEEAISRVNHEILKENPDSVIGLVLTGRIRLAQGFLTAAEYYYGVAECLQQCTKSKLFIGGINSIVSLAEFDVTTAVQECYLALELENNIELSYPFPANDIVRHILHNFDERQACTALNNLAVTLVYDGRVKDSTRLLEEFYFSTEKPLITFSGVKTLLTLYEFLPSPQAKIYRLKNHIQSFSPDDRDIQSLVLF